MEAEENGANNELLYLSAWSIMRKAYIRGDVLCINMLKAMK